MKTLKKITNIFTWFLRSNVAPIDDQQNENLKKINHMSSKKFSMTLIAVAIIAFMYFASIFMLFLFPNDPHVSALVSMYKDMIVAIAAIVASLVGIQGLVDWKHNSGGYVESQNVNSVENRYIEEYLTGPKENDYTVDIEIARNKK